LFITYSVYKLIKYSWITGPTQLAPFPFTACIPLKKNKLWLDSECLENKKNRRVLHVAHTVQPVHIKMKRDIRQTLKTVCPYSR